MEMSGRFTATKAADKANRDPSEFIERMWGISCGWAGTDTVPAIDDFDDLPFGLSPCASREYHDAWPLPRRTRWGAFLGTAPPARNLRPPDLESRKKNIPPNCSYWIE